MRGDAISSPSRKFVPILSRSWRFPRRPPADKRVGGSSARCTRYHQCFSAPNGQYAVFLSSMHERK